MDKNRIDLAIESEHPDADRQAARELAAREPIFHHPELGVSREDFDGMMANEYWEVGASGRTYSREFVLNMLEQRHRQPVDERLVMSEFECRRISAETYLVTYLLEQESGRLSRRCTLWRHGPDGWRALYHQGTLTNEGG